jgi:CRP/FNR family transcriptional regulator, dissimilatory nitrate respiration regulator
MTRSAQRALDAAAFARRRRKLRRLAAIIATSDEHLLDPGQAFSHLSGCIPVCKETAVPVTSKSLDRTRLRTQLRQNVTLKLMDATVFAELEPHLCVVECRKGERLLNQGDQEMEQYFVLDGILKRVVTNDSAKEMILRFAAEGDIETSYAAWRLKTPAPYSIVAVTPVQVAKLPLPKWVAFIEDHPRTKHDFEYEVMRLMSEIMAHTITLHLLDAPGRLQRFLRKHPHLAERLHKKELASYLNLSAETLSRLTQRERRLTGLPTTARH